MISELPEEFVDSLQLLASEPEQQFKVFPDWVVVADELALTFDAAVEHLQRELDARDLSIDDRLMLQRVDELNERLLSPAPEHKQQWSDAAVRYAVGWSEIREEARHLLADLGIDRTLPRNRGSDYVQG